jgi:hypothetical protein
VSLFLWLLAWQTVTALLALVIVLGKETAVNFHNHNKAEMKALMQAAVAFAVAFGIIAFFTLR